MDSQIEQTTKCIICGKDIPEHRLKQNKKTCCRLCQMKTPETRQRKSQSIKSIMTDELKNKISERTKQALANEQSRQKRSDNAKKLWENKDYRQKLSKIQKDRYKLEENRKKTSNSIKRAYENPELHKKISERTKQALANEQSRQKRSDNAKKLWENKDYRQKLSKSMKLTCSNTNYRKNLSNKLKRAYAEHGQEILNKRYETMKKNNSYAKSSWEDYTYELLLTKFKKEDIERQYLDKKRYPFKCDFYIKSLDLFIETHYGEFHQYEPFDIANKEHLKRLKELEAKAALKLKKTNKESRYHNMIYTWTDLDIRKANCAKDNNLNWIVFYTLNDFSNWLISYD